MPVERPLVPDRGDESGALVVLSAGTWTDGELAGIAEACADAEHEVVGTVVAAAVRARSKQSAGRRPEGAVPVLVGAEDTGSGSG